MTIVPAPPANVVGPGVQLYFESDFIGPIPVDADWDIRFCIDSDLLELLWHEVLPSGGFGSGILRPLTQPLFGGQGVGQLVTGDTAYVQVRLLEHDGDVIDSGAISAPYSETAGLAMQAYNRPAATVEASFTAEDRAVLQANLAAVTVQLPSVGAVGGLVGRAIGELLGGIPPRYTSRHGSML